MNVQDRIIKTLKNRKNGLTSKQLTKKMFAGIQYKTVQNRIGELITSGKITYGKWVTLDEKTNRYNQTYVVT